MRTRPTCPLMVVAAAVLLLSGCGEEAADGPDVIAGAASEHAAAPPTSAPAAEIKRPTVTLPGDMKNTFEGPRTGNAVKDAVLADTERRIGSIDQAISSGDMKHSGLAFYSTDEALTAAYRYTKAFLDRADTWTGTVRYFDREVTYLKGATATSTYCVDESRAFVKHRRTGKTERNAASARSFVAYETDLVRNGDGVWQTTSVTAERGAAACRP
ncbi:hypothetical protein [Streptomyces atriruber]|uniref:hypothetical protein n=1 Tax=Streptomyces atriruber TaxID=545121 RepID=UPI0007C8648A|nr:hypothetical protein [Streptomyces atriruber]